MRAAAGPAVSSLGACTTPTLAGYRDVIGMPIRAGILQPLTLPGFYLYYPSRKQQPAKLKAFVDYAQAHYAK